MTAEEIVAALNLALPAGSVEVAPAVDQPTLVVGRDQIVEVCRTLRDVPALGFQLLDLTAVDWWPGEPRFQIVYHMASLEHAWRLRLKVFLPGENARIPTVSTLWPGADWMEREVFDLFGIVFDGHPDLRRVLMPEDWEGYPLRKDYPVQIRMPVKIYEPLQVTPEEFQKRLAEDRKAREARQAASSE